MVYIFRVFSWILSFDDKSDYFLSDPGGLTSTLSGWTTKKIVRLPYQIKKKRRLYKLNSPIPPHHKTKWTSKFRNYRFLAVFSYRALSSILLWGTVLLIPFKTWSSWKWFKFNHILKKAKCFLNNFSLIFATSSMWSTINVSRNFNRILNKIWTTKG